MRRQRGTRGAGPAINIAPLIDMVFILLIFFMVTTSFVRDSGIEVERPRASESGALNPRSLRVSVTASGSIYAQGTRFDIATLSERVEAFVRSSRDAAVVIIPDERTPSGRLVEVLDTVKGAGARDVAIATREKREG